MFLLCWLRLRRWCLFCWLLVVFKLLRLGLRTKKFGMIQSIVRNWCNYINLTCDLLFGYLTFSIFNGSSAEIWLLTLMHILLWKWVVHWKWICPNVCIASFIRFFTVRVLLSNCPSWARISVHTRLSLLIWKMNRPGVTSWVRKSALMHNISLWMVHMVILMSLRICSLAMTIGMTFNLRVVWVRLIVILWLVRHMHIGVKVGVHLHFHWIIERVCWVGLMHHWRHPEIRRVARSYLVFS
jgi:hypothetical protein